MVEKIWGAAHFCVRCDQELRHREVMHSLGQCARCGYIGPNECTIVATIRRRYYWERIAPWWQFWRIRWRRVFVPDYDPEPG